MLKRWIIENFKSYSGKVEFHLSPVTVLAGANSSGKSTFIQGLLLAKQTIQHGSPQRAVALNGPILRLGRFDDIHNVKSSFSYFGFGGTLSDGSEFESFNILPNWMRSNTRQASDIPEEASLYSTFYVTGNNPVDEIPRLYPELQSCEVTFSTEDEDIDYDTEDEDAYHSVFVTNKALRLEASSETPSMKLRSHGVAMPRPVHDDLLKYDVVEIDEGTQSTLPSLPSARILGCGARQFFPGPITLSYDRSAWKAQRIARSIVRYPGRASNIFNDEELPYTVVESIKKRLTQTSKHAQTGEEFLPPRPEQPYQLHEVFSALRRLSRQPSGTRGSFLGSNFMELEQLRSSIVNTLSNHYKAEISIRSEDSEEFRAVENHFRDFFTNGVKYLGPLRDEPRPLYPLESLANPTDVGFKGEHTAAVLDLNRDRMVATIDLPKFDKVEKFHFRQLRLGAAVSGWLSYLGVAESVLTTDRGKIGHELQVNTVGIDKSHDLTNVGVGVSQVLPIVVMALLAQKGSLLIFEQPELHLHPKVQARLADFFLGMSLLGKQCVVETHSEYLIERFRRRIAEDESDGYKDLISVYFFELLDGQTNVREVEINEYGAIQEWPVEFFDQAVKETDHIISAAAAKRLQKRSSSLK